MATTDKPRIFDPVAETEQARAIAARYRCEYVDLREAAIDHDLFRSIPVDLMFRYNFVPMQANNGTSSGSIQGLYHGISPRASLSNLAF